MKIQISPVMEENLIGYMSTHDISSLTMEEAYNQIPVPAGYRISAQESACILEFLRQMKKFGTGITAVLSKQE